MEKKIGKKKAGEKASKKTGKKTEAVKEAKPVVPMIIKGSPPVRKVKAFQNLLPSLPTDVRKALEESIRSEGLRDPLVVWKEKGSTVPALIDGYNRLDICKKYKIEYSIIEKLFDDEEKVKLWMWENQESRRNMTPYQRIEVVLQFKGIIEEQAKDNQRTKGGLGCEKVNKAKLKQIRTNEVLGKRAGVSYAQVGKVRDIQAKIAEGLISEEVLHDLREGKERISRIHKQYCADAKKVKQPKRDLTERSNSFIKFLKMHATRFFPQTEDRNYINDQLNQLSEQLSEWASSEKNDNASQS